LLLSPYQRMKLRQFAPNIGAAVSYVSRSCHERFYLRKIDGVGRIDRLGDIDDAPPLGAGPNRNVANAFGAPSEL
jgi:hypothetical protein